MTADRTAILVVNGFDRIGLWGTTFEVSEALRYPWLDLCLREVERRSQGTDYQVFVWDNSELPALRDIAVRRGARLYPSEQELASARDAEPAKAGFSPAMLHASSLQRLLAEVGDEFGYVVTLDTDAFPIRDGWIEVLKSNLSSAALTGVWRDEMEGRLAAFVHPSCLGIRRGRLLQMEDPFSFEGVQDVGQWITNEVLVAGERIQPLRRSNALNAHFLIGGIYGDLIYHQSAGSRRPVFRMTQGEEADNHAYEVLRKAAFADVDHLIGVLRGATPDDLGISVDLASPAIRRAWPGRGLRNVGSQDGEVG